jgi:hypothetical protein
LIVRIAAEAASVAAIVAAVPTTTLVLDDHSKIRHPSPKEES